MGYKWPHASLGSTPVSSCCPTTSTDMEGSTTTVQALETRRSTEKELMHRSALMYTRSDYHKMYFTTQLWFWKKSRRQCQEKVAAQGRAPAITTWTVSRFPGRRCDLEKHQEWQQEKSAVCIHNHLRSQPTKQASWKALSCSPQPLPGTPTRRAQHSTSPLAQNGPLDPLWRGLRAHSLATQKTSKPSFEACLTTWRPLSCLSETLFLNELHSNPIAQECASPSCRAVCALRDHVNLKLNEYLIQVKSFLCTLI